MDFNRTDLSTVIWYFIPGGLLSVVILLCYPWELEGREELLFFAAPVIGFCLHQLTRFGLEDEYSYSATRSHLTRLREIYGDELNVVRVWRIAFNSKDFDSRIREQCKRMWHFIFSVMTVGAAAFAGVLVVFYSEVTASLSSDLTSLRPLLAMLLTILWVVCSAFARRTRLWVDDMEAASIDLQRDMFDNVVQSIG